MEDRGKYRNDIPQEREDEERLIGQTMLSSIDKVKAYKLFIRQRLRYPFLKGKIGELEPNVFFSFTDHPLDIDGTAMTLPFTVFRKHRRRSARSVLRVELAARTGNSFLFKAKGYNVFKIKNIKTMNRHEYLVNDRTPYRELALSIDFLRDDTYRLRLSPGSEVPANETPMLYRDITEPETEVHAVEDDEKYALTTKRLSLHVYKTGFRIEVYDAAGTLITESGGQTKCEFPTPFDSFPLGFIRDGRSGREYGVESFVLYPGEAIYGLGERFGPVNRVGQSLGMWNFTGYGNTSGRVYKNIPFFMSTRGYGVFINESRPITFWIGTKETCKNQFAVEGELIDYFFFFGPSFKRILHLYTALTGKAALPPLWSFGTWMSRISYFSQAQVYAVMGKLREMRFPTDVIHIDTGWFEKDWRCDWRFDPVRFPDPETMFAEAHRRGFRICLWQIPHVIDETDVYDEAKKKGALAKNNGPFAFLYTYSAHLIDFSNPDAVSWYQGLLAPLLEMGADTIKTDMGEQVEPSMRFALYDGRQMHNLFPLLYQKAAFEVIERVLGAGNAVIWARSAYAGAQRYPVHWSGDNSSNHENLLSCLRSGLSLGLSGFTFWSQDTGGFVGLPSDEVYIRWVQLSVFQSHFRFHGNPPHYKEPWNFMLETQRIVRKYLEFRYRLIPYLYSESESAARNGLPLLQHMVIEFQDDPTVYHIEDQFMCGRSLLVAPILEKNDTRSVYLPGGGWYDLWTGGRMEGPRWMKVKAGIGKIPVYIREGTVLPLAKAVQHTGELSLDNMTLRVYPDGEGKASCRLRNGERTISIKASFHKGIIHLDAKGFRGKALVEFPLPGKGLSARLNGKAVTVRKAAGL